MKGIGEIHMMHRGRWIWFLCMMLEDRVRGKESDFLKKKTGVCETLFIII